MVFVGPPLSASAPSFGSIGWPETGPTWSVPVELNEALWISDEKLESVTALDDALTRLEALSPRQGQLLQHRYFGGLSLEESATAIGVSLATAKRELRSARAWLALELKGEPIQ